MNGIQQMIILRIKVFKEGSLLGVSGGDRNTSTSPASPRVIEATKRERGAWGITGPSHHWLGFGLKAHDVFL
jgi:hypothetical protein